MRVEERISFLRSVSFCAELPEPALAALAALTDAELLALPRERLLQVVAQHPALALALLKEFTGRLRHMVDLVDDLALHSVQGRLAGLLLEQAAAADRGEALP